MRLDLQGLRRTAAFIWLRRTGLGGAAWLWRRLMFRTTFIAVAGSSGKTTTKELLARCLGAHAPTVHSPGTRNSRRHSSTERSILKVRPWHRYAVIEVGVQAPGDMAPEARLLRPDVAVMLNVRGLHLNMFDTVEAVAAEKSILFSSLRSGGTAVINADDPLVVAMTTDLPCRVVRFGAKGPADVTFRDAAAAFPDRLSLVVASNGTSYPVTTRLVGTHWTNAVVAALTAAVACGMPLSEAVAPMAEVEPFAARLQPVTLPDREVTFLRDEFNGSLATFEAAFKVLRDATAARKVVILSDLSDSKKNDRKRAGYLGRMAAELGDLAIFVGPTSHHAAAAAVRNGLAESQARAFESVLEAGRFVTEALRPGDLVLMKGRTSSHLSRVYLSLLGPVSCDRYPCPLRIACDRCPELGFTSRPEIAEFMITAAEA